MKISIPIEVKFDDMKSLINDLGNLQTYKLSEGDEMTLVDIEDVADVLAKHVKAMEAERKTGWIPCSERLPEKGNEVLVCYDFKGHRSVFIGALYGYGEFHGYDDEYLTSEGRKCRKAVAWMPLPEPYKGEDGGGE